MQLHVPTTLGVALLAALLAPAPSGAAAQSERSALGVSPQGRIVDGLPRTTDVSPRGTCRVQCTPTGGDVVEFASRVEIVTADGARSVLPRVVGAAVWATDAERIVVLADHCSNVAPRPLTVLALDGTVLFSRPVSGVANPVLGPSGDVLAYRTRGGVVTLDLERFEAARHPRYDAFALDAAGRLIGASATEDGAFALEVRDGTRRVARTVVREPVRAVAALEGDVLVLGPRTLRRWTPGRSAPVPRYTAPDGAELRDLRVDGDRVLVGEHVRQGNLAVGRLVQPGATTSAATVATSSAMLPGVPDLAPQGVDEIPWPLAPNSQQPIGNSYAEYQRYGGSPYMHPGIDVMGSPGQPVYAVADGEVKAVLTTSGTYHWRVATANVPGAAQSEGYLYAHLHLPTIAVSPGDLVVKGQYLGDLVFWPVADFTHTHFARIVDAGVQWQGDWLNTDNCHLQHPRRTEASVPVFEPAIGNDLFAFCRNDTSNYLNPNALRGQVDIIAHVGDTIDSTWVCTVQTLRYSIHPAGNPGAPVIDDRLAVEFDMPMDTYIGGPVDDFLVDLLYKQDSTCQTRGDYNAREFFHILTNSDGDETYEASDVAESWDTRQVPDGDYVITVTATDAAGNATTASMTVTVDNP